jgi:hypothetical protein
MKLFFEPPRGYRGAKKRLFALLSCLRNVFIFFELIVKAKIGTDQINNQLMYLVTLWSHYLKQKNIKTLKHLENRWLSVLVIFQAVVNKVNVSTASMMF